MWIILFCAYDKRKRSSVVRTSILFYKEGRLYEKTVYEQGRGINRSNHSGTIYKATNAYRCGSTSKTYFYIDNQGRLRHPRQCGVNITKEKAKELGWEITKRDSKNRYFWFLPNNPSHKKKLVSLCKLKFDFIPH